MMFFLILNINACYCILKTLLNIGWYLRFFNFFHYYYFLILIFDVA